jgi:hypothetical protein
MAPRGLRISFSAEIKTPGPAAKRQKMTSTRELRHPYKRPAAGVDMVINPKDTRPTLVSASRWRPRNGAAAAEEHGNIL